MVKIYTSTESVWCEERQMYVLSKAEHIDYCGPVTECKGLFSGKKAPAPPPPPAPKTVQDLINGVETVTETRDGKEYVVTRQLPLTAEQQAFKDDITRRLDNIDKIGQGLAVFNPDYKPMVDAMRAWQQQTRGQLFGEANRAQQDELARRGLGNSTAADTARQGLGLQLGQQVQQDELNLFGLAEQQRAADLERQKSSLALRSDINTGELARLGSAGAQTAATQGTRLGQDANIAQQNYNNQLAAFNAQRPSLGSQLLSTATQLGAAYFTGGGTLAGLGLGGLSTAAATRQASPVLGAMFGSTLAKK